MEPSQVPQNLTALILSFHICTCPLVKLMDTVHLAVTGPVGVLDDFSSTIMNRNASLSTKDCYTKKNK